MTFDVIENVKIPLKVMYKKGGKTAAAKSKHIDSHLLDKSQTEFWVKPVVMF